MTQTKSNPKTKEEWDEYFRKDKALTERLKNNQSSYLDLSDQDFTEVVKGYSQEKLKAFLVKMRDTRMFYRKVLEEAYYTEHPEKKKTDRYLSSTKLYDSVNRKGKIVNSLITQ